MEHFSYSLFVSLMHSFWQAALLVCLYFVSEFFIKRNNPVHKRNLLFILLATQVFLTISTFLIYYNGAVVLLNEYIASNISELLIRQPNIEILAPWLTGVYISVIAIKTIRLIINWQRFRISSRAAWIKPPINLRLFTGIKANEFGIHRKVKLWYSNTVNTPLTFGFLKPVILLPVALVNNLSLKETETLILHELSHIKSHDYFFNWLLIICETLFFFNPFVKIITERIKLEREKNCDTRVLQFNYPALNYAETLLKTARFKATPAPFYLAAVLKNAQLVKRIRFFTEETNLQFHKRNYSMFAIVPVITIFVLNILLLNFINNNKNILQAGLPLKIKTGISSNNNENMNTRFSTTILPVSRTDSRVTDDNNNHHVPEEKTNTSQLQTIAKALDSQQEVLMNEAIAENFVMPASLVQPDESKEIILKDENSSTGRSVTKVYKLRMEKGEWKATLMWTITETRAASDSIPHLKDTTRFYNLSQ